MFFVIRRSSNSSILVTILKTMKQRSGPKGCQQTCFWSMAGKRPSCEEMIRGSWKIPMRCSLNLHHKLSARHQLCNLREIVLAKSKKIQAGDDPSESTWPQQMSTNWTFIGRSVFVVVSFSSGDILGRDSSLKSSNHNMSQPRPTHAITCLHDCIIL